MSDRYDHLAQQVATAETPATDPPPLQTVLRSALQLVEIAHEVAIDGMSEMEQALDALRSQAHATGISRLVTMHRDGPFEVVWVGQAAPLPCLYWLIQHESRDEQDPTLTRWVVLDEFETLDQAENAMACRVTHGSPEPDPDLEAPEPDFDGIECGVCGVRPSSFTWTPVVGKHSPPAVPLPVCTVCAELIRQHQLPQFSIGDVTFAVLEGQVWGARRVTR